jgi:hypothetical protein
MAETFLNTGTQAGNREDLKNVLTDVNYKKTPLFSMCGKTDAKAILHEWMEDTLQGGTAVNARAEGFTPTPAAADNDVRVRRTNNCEIIARCISVSRTQNVIDKAGLGTGSEYDHQLERKMKALALDVNYTMWNQTGVTRAADTPTAGAMKGYFEISTVNTKAAGDVLLSEDVYGAFCQQMVESGVDPDIVFCSGFNKRQISSWASDLRRYASGEDRIKNTVAVYEGDWGTQEIVFDKHVPTTKIAIAQKDQLKVGMLDPFQHIPLAKTIDGDRGYVVTELTFEYGAQKACGSITGLKVTV